LNMIMPPLSFLLQSTRRIRVSNTEAPTDSYVDVHPDPENRAVLDAHDRTVVPVGTLPRDIRIGPEFVYFIHRLKVMVPPCERCRDGMAYLADTEWPDRALPDQ